MTNLLILSQRCEILQDEPLLDLWGQRVQMIIVSDYPRAHLSPAAVGKLAEVPLRLWQREIQLVFRDPAAIPLCLPSQVTAAIRRTQ